MLTLSPAVVTTSDPAFAVIDGNLCRLNRNGTVAAAHQPLATGILEFRHGPLRLYVREHPYGLLPGVPNLYCLDLDFRLLWLAQWPLEDDPCGRIVAESGNALVVESVRGVTLLVDQSTGRFLRINSAVEVAS